MDSKELAEYVKHLEEVGFNVTVLNCPSKDPSACLKNRSGGDALKRVLLQIREAFK